MFLMCSHMIPGSVLSPLHLRKIAFPDPSLCIKNGGDDARLSGFYADESREPRPRESSFMSVE